MPGTLFVVATPIGNLEDISARALRVLGEASIVAAEDTRRTRQLLERYAIRTPTTSFHEHNETGKSGALLARLARGERVALVTDAGTPVVSDPGQTLIRAAIDAGIRVETIPGPSAVMAALAGSGLPAETFTFLGFPPTKANDRKKWFEAVRTAGRTVIFFEAPHRIAETLHQLRATVGDCQVAVGRELTKVHEEWVRGPISKVSEALTEPRGEFTVVAEIGRMADVEPSSRPVGADILREFGERTKIAGVTKRKAINVIARRHGLPPNQVYEAIERAKKSIV